MKLPDAKVEKVYLSPKSRGLSKVRGRPVRPRRTGYQSGGVRPSAFRFSQQSRNRMKFLYWERNGFRLWTKRLESERFKTSPDFTDEVIVLTVQELNWLLEGFDLWRNRRIRF